LKFLTKNSDYAIRALSALAKEKGEFISARRVSVQQKIPYQFLRGILQALIRNKLVVSQEGGGGGFKISVNPGKISLVDIIRIFQGDLRLSDCMFRSRICPQRPTCVLRKEIKRIERMVEKEFKTIKLAKLVQIPK
jgi:Rrf2 family transcriptional regulator, cysteine metabolism repressor